MTHPNKKLIEDWYQDIKNPEYGLEWVLKFRPTLEPDAKQILDKAVKKYEQEQEDIRNKPRDDREVEMLRHARHSKWAAWIAIPISVLALLISVWVANLPK